LPQRFLFAAFRNYSAGNRYFLALLSAFAPLCGILPLALFYNFVKLNESDKDALSAKQRQSDLSTADLGSLLLKRGKTA